MSFVEMVHPDIPDAVQEVPEEAFRRVWKARGWVLKPVSALHPEQTDKEALEKMSKDELEDFAENEMGLNVSSAKTKADLVAMIKGTTNDG